MSTVHPAFSYNKIARICKKKIGELHLHLQFKHQVWLQKSKQLTFWEKKTFFSDGTNYGLIEKLTHSRRV